MSRATHLLLAVALLAIVLAGVHAVAPLLSALLVAVVLAQVMSPVVDALQRRGWPLGAAFGSTLVLTLILGVGVAFFVGVSLAQVALQLPAYSQRLQSAAQELPAGGVGPEMRSTIVDAVIQTIPALLAAVGEATGMALLAFLIFAFMLWDGLTLPRRLISAGPVANTVLSGASAFNADVRHFLIITATLGALQGGAMAVFLLLVGVDFALLWGLLFAVMAFVPAVGLLIAAVPPIVMAFLQFGLVGALIVALGTFLITNAFSQFMKPKYLGRGLNLSRLAVFLSFVVWGAAIGPVGALLAVPLTLFVKMLLAAFDETRWLSAVISDRALEPQAVEGAEPVPIVSASADA